MPVVPAPEKDHINENRSEVSKRQGQNALQFSVRTVLAQTEAILKSLPSVVQANGIDALIIDTVQFYAELGAIQLGMPYVHVANGLHWDYSGYTPLCLYGWPHETTPAALARNREGVAKWANLLDSASGGIKAHAESIGLKIDWNDLSSTVSPFASITQIPRAFDFESSHWPSRFYHTGPFHDGKSREKVDFPWERLTIQPPSSPYQKMNGLYMMPRTIDKMRAQLSGGKTGAYSITTPFGPGLSILLLEGIGVTEEHLLQRIGEVSAEDEIADWLRKHADLSSVADINERLRSQRIEDVLRLIPAPGFYKFYPAAVNMPKTSPMFEVLLEDDRVMFRKHSRVRPQIVK